MKNSTKQPRLSHAEPGRDALPVPTEETPATTASDTLASLKNAPLHKARLGRVNLTIWMREDKSGTVRFSINLARSYKTESGYRDTAALDQGDLANAIALLNEAQAVLPPVLPHPQA